MIGRRRRVEELNFKLKDVGVVMLGVEQLARAVAFYRDKLGLVLKGQNEGFAFLDGGGVTLCLSEALARAGGPIAGAVEVVFSVEDVRGAHKALAARESNSLTNRALSPALCGRPILMTPMGTSCRFSGRKVRAESGGMVASLKSI